MLFTNQEIALMRRIGLKMDLEHHDSLSSDEWIEIEETIGDRLVLHELDENYEPTPDGVLCEDILEKVARH